MILARAGILRVNQVLLRNGPRTLGSQIQFLRATSSAAANNHKENREKIKQAGTLGLAVLAGAFAAGTVTLAESEFWHPKPVSVDAINKPGSKFYSIAADNLPPKRPDLPTIPLEKVAEHNDEGDMWYTFRGAVYDMSFFLNGHPGGAPVSTPSSHSCDFASKYSQC